jgi:hypothetical protein
MIEHTSSMACRVLARRLQVVDLLTARLRVLHPRSGFTICLHLRRYPATCFFYTGDKGMLEIESHALNCFCVMVCGILSLQILWITSKTLDTNLHTKDDVLRRAAHLATCKKHWTIFG